MKEKTKDLGKRMQDILTTSYWRFSFDRYDGEFTFTQDWESPFLFYFSTDKLLGEYDPILNIFLCRNINLYGYRYKSWFRKRLQHAGGIRDILSGHFRFQLTEAW